MRRKIFLSAALCCFCALFSVDASAQLINELGIDPAGTDQPCEFIELKGTPGAALTNIFFVALEGDGTSALGTADFVVEFQGPVFGTNGLLVLTGTAACGERVYPPETTRSAIALLDAANGLENGTISFLLISSTTTITAGTDYDSDNNGVLELPAGATVLDAVGWSDAGAGDLVYGGVTIASAVDPIGAATRLPGNITANSVSAWYGGDFVPTGSGGTNNAINYFATNRTANFPLNGGVSPGYINFRDSVVDFNGGLKTDFSVIRSGSAVDPLAWYTLDDTGAFTGTVWGVGADLTIPADYDGDFKDDIAIWRPANSSTFCALLSATQTARCETFGIATDDPTVIGDYNGDGKEDIAVYREGAAGQQSFWFYRTTPGGGGSNFTTIPWGTGGDRPAPGDYDGDNRNDFVIYRGDGLWAQLSASGNISYKVFGSASDEIVPGDYDGDGDTDLAVVRVSGADLIWYYEPSGTDGITATAVIWGLAAGDELAQGDYDGDGRTDQTVWRPADGAFYIFQSSTRTFRAQPWGAPTDGVVANYNVH